MVKLTALQQAAHDIGAKGSEPTEAERLAFESWMRGHCWAVIGEWDGKQYKHAHESTGFVHGGAMETRRLWAAWRDRGAVARVLAEQAQAVEPARYIWNQCFDMDSGRGWMEVCKNYDPRLPEYRELHDSVDWSNAAQVRDFTVLYTHPIPASSQDEVTRLAATELYDFQEATRCDTAAQFKAQQVAVPLRECHYESPTLRVCNKCGQRHDKAIFASQGAKP